MDFGNLLSRAWDIVWNNKWLFILGFLVALGSGGSGGGGGGNFGNFNSDSGDTPQEFQDFNFEDFSEEDLQQFLDEVLPFAGIGLAILIPLLCVAFVIGIALWVVSMIATGGLIHGVDQLESGAMLTFSEAWQAGWQKATRLLGVGIIPAIPGAVLGIAMLILGVVFAGMAGLGGLDNFASSPNLGVFLPLIVIICVVGLVSMVLNILSTFAFRAAMLEDTTVFESYGRGWEVLSSNLGPVVILFLIQVALGFAVGLVSLIAICCFPLVWVIGAVVTTYFSALWTLAWREWTNTSSGPAADVAPAV